MVAFNILHNANHIDNKLLLVSKQFSNLTPQHLPVLCSGLAALPIRPTMINQLEIFHNRIMRSLLKLSDSSPVPALHFLLGELPIQGRLHLQLLSLFYNIWSNPNTTIYKIVLYLLQMASPKSHTWTAHLRHTCLLYRLPDPLALLQGGQVWTKSSWKILTKNKSNSTLWEHVTS